ncbi:hypothetical protein B0T17DRAFT_621661 [Bombardia bombarda]|uniref:Uncharacterized protein n=1 Tax=Bombardia bombarda TaxID=252184 RepID=A0AA39TZX0_9PEZI|nr:hypothetical protein B0T17DRAFT_621661 [Bombardia bombarda]
MCSRIPFEMIGAYQDVVLAVAETYLFPGEQTAAHIDSNNDEVMRRYRIHKGEEPQQVTYPFTYSIAHLESLRQKITSASTDDQRVQAAGKDFAGALVVLMALASEQNVAQHFLPNPNAAAGSTLPRFDIWRPSLQKLVRTVAEGTLGLASNSIDVAKMIHGEVKEAYEDDVVAKRSEGDQESVARIDKAFEHGVEALRNGQTTVSVENFADLYCLLEARLRTLDQDYYSQPDTTRKDDEDDGDDGDDGDKEDDGDDGDKEDDDPETAQLKLACLAAAVEVVREYKEDLAQANTDSGACTIMKSAALVLRHVLAEKLIAKNANYEVSKEEILKISEEKGNNDSEKKGILEATMEEERRAKERWAKDRRTMAEMWAKAKAEEEMSRRKTNEEEGDDSEEKGNNDSEEKGNDSEKKGISKATTMEEERRAKERWAKSRRTMAEMWAKAKARAMEEGDGEEWVVVERPRWI